MSMTPAQLDRYATDIAAITDPQGVKFRDDGNAPELANWYNQQSGTRTDARTNPDPNLANADLMWVLRQQVSMLDVNDAIDLEWDDGGTPNGFMYWQAREDNQASPPPPEQIPDRFKGWEQFTRAEQIRPEARKVRENLLNVVPTSDTVNRDALLSVIVIEAREVEAVLADPASGPGGGNGANPQTAAQRTHYGMVSVDDTIRALRQAGAARI